ncbi:MAG: hypothetical protein HQ582_00485 [Planctomycetes bacterium]|nr:hypothetical protein [Planctomycetota bacterium]
MNPSDDHLPENLPPLDDQRFDLLVDGELPESDRRNLLSTLDDLPGGWRRCALAFLEAQSWKREMRAVRREPASPPQAARPAGRSEFPGGRWGALLAVAASFLIALTLGLALDRATQPDAGSAPSPFQVAVEDERVESELPDGSQPGTDPVLPAPGAPPDDQWQLVTLPVGLGADGASSLQLPAMEQDELDAGWPGQFAPSVPDDVVQAFERSGHKMQRNRRLMPFDLNDGRRVVVPCEEVEFHYVGNSAYQ